MTAPHPTYPNPVIAEALCEIHVRKDGADAKWPTTLVGDFHDAIRSNFPRMEPLSEFGLEVSFTGGGPNQRFVAPKTRFRFHHDQQPVVVHLGPGILSVNVLAPYPGWIFFRRNMLEVWSSAVRVIEPSQVSRIGLRYINRIPRASLTETPSRWLRPTRFLPPAVLDHSDGFSARTQVHTDEGNRTIVSLQHEQPTQSEECGAVVFDIDRITEHRLPIESSVIGSQVDVLHDDVWEVFSDARTHHLSELMGA